MRGIFFMLIKTHVVRRKSFAALFLPDTARS
jgi:hypothetical protein